MNHRFVIHHLGLILLVLSLFLGAVAVWEAVDVGFNFSLRPAAFQGLLAAAGVGLLTGGLLWWAGLRGAGGAFGRRETFLLVAASWLVGTALAGLPYWIWAHLELGDGHLNPNHPFLNFTACYFESASGLTTTGASVLGSPGASIEALPRGLLLWRAMTQWLGGLGIVVLFVAVLPALGVAGKRILQAESPVSGSSGLRPHVRQTARMMWLIYLVLTAANILALNVMGSMSLFDSVCHAFTTVSTGGFSTRDASIGYYDSAAVEWICILFMLACGVNFVLYAHLLQGNWRQAWRDTELRVYLVLLGLITLIVAFDLIQAGDPLPLTTGQAVQPELGEVLRQATFTTVSLYSTTGFTSADHDQWPTLSLGVLFGFLLVGGCAGSTAGGIKVVRFWILLKVLLLELERAFRPHVVRPLKMSGIALDPEVKTGAVVMVLAFILLTGLGVLLLLLLEVGQDRCTFQTAFTASLAAITNVGPGIGAVGATDNYGWLSKSSLAVLSGLMLLGRLELYVLLVLLTPRFWRSE